MQCLSSKDIRPALTAGEFIRNSNVILWNGNATCKQNLSPQLSDGLASSRRGRAAAKTVASTLIWFSFWNGIITEVYYPTVDRLQLRDLQYLFTDGNIFFH